MTFAYRPRFQWRLRSRSLSLGSRTLLMGILNVTPDSFSDGGRFFSCTEAVRHALVMLDDGADIIDLGGESTRPTSTPIPPGEEQARILPVVREILAARPGAVLSIDTYHADTARAAIEAGAEIVNDVSGMLWDAHMARTCADLRCGAVLMHTRGRPHEWRTLPPLEPAEVVPLVLRELEERTGSALAAGICRDQLMLDPGFGFGKILDENLPLLAGFGQLHSLGFPVLAGVSRKSFLTRAIARTAESARNPNAAPAHPELPTAIANTAAVLAGAHILRVHDVGSARDTITIADRILQAIPPPSSSSLR